MSRNQTIEPRNTVNIVHHKVLDAYFATMKSEDVYVEEEENQTEESPTTTETTTPDETYTVKSGDSLGIIASANGTTTANLIAINDSITEANKNDLDIGQIIIIKKGTTTTTSGSSSGKGEYTVKSGDSLGKIASANGTTTANLIAINDSITEANKNDLKVGQKIKLSKGNTKQKITFERLNKTTLGSDVYIVVETDKLQDKQILININQGKVKGIVEKDTAVKITQNDKETVLIEATVGEYAKDDKLSNKDDFKDWAIAKIKLAPKTKETLKTYTDEIKKLTDKKTLLYLLIDAHSKNDITVVYNGRNPDKDGNPDERTTPNYWLDMEGNWFELSEGCDCGKDYDKKFQCTRYGSAYGPVYWGSLKLENYSYWNDLVKENKVTQEEREILVGMSENEGKLDSVQSYDSEILTAGAMQKTVNPQGKGEFPIQVQEFKNSNPSKYKSLFEDCGWTVENKTLYYKDLSDSSAKKITGKALKTKIREGFKASEFKKKLKCKPLEPIVKAMNDKDFQAKQVEDFIDRLKNKVLPIKPVGYSYKLKDYLLSKLGKATVLDHHINRPAYVDNDFGEALDNFFSKKDKEVNDFNKGKDEKDQKAKISRNPANWGTNHAAYEKNVLDDYGKNRRGTDMENRYNKMKAKL